MKRPPLILQIGALASSMLLVGAYVGFQVARATGRDRTELPDSSVVQLEAAVSSDAAPVASAPAAPDEVTVMSGSKFAAIDPFVVVDPGNKDGPTSQPAAHAPAARRGTPQPVQQHGGARQGARKVMPGSKSAPVVDP